MIGWATVLFWILVCLAVGQALLTWRFVSAMRRVRVESPAEVRCPKVAVILCLRGTDPFLPACLQAILQQDYPDYDLHVVVDSREDPAWMTVDRVVARCGATNVTVRPLTARRETCSLKCSSLCQAVSELDASYEIIALLDADTVPHRTWLRELVAPLADDEVAAATGNRWYMPASASWGALVRWLWNAGAAVIMYLWRIPWGGTLALKTGVLRQSDLLERWGHAFCEDTMLYGVLRRLGYRVAFVPSLMMVNRETCTLTNCYGWVRRQLLTARLYHPAWVLVVAHGLVISLTQLMGIASLGACAAMGYGTAAAWLAVGMGVYWATMTGLLVAVERGVRRVSAARGEPTAWLDVSALPRVTVAILLTQVLYPVALVSTAFLRTVRWRGVRYRVAGPGDIRLLDYRLYVDGSREDQRLGSL